RRDLGYNYTVELDRLTTGELLRLYADILTKLLGRGVVRSRNAPAGDLAEYLVKTAFGGELAPPSAKSWDVQVGPRRLQVKVRLLDAGDRRSHSYSTFRSWDFDACVFVLLDARTYEVTRAVEVPVAGVQEMARETAWVKGFRIGTSAEFGGVAGAVDRTAEIRQARASLD
ncbi:MAG: hypothetical protein JWN39_70, partial [Ilumatobacteraceae bacterium]|nr:hypothetical protein [Ilumatobacteraceae bacterium]